jgi:hypothetical protein
MIMKTQSCKNAHPPQMYTLKIQKNERVIMNLSKRIGGMEWLLPPADKPVAVVVAKEEVRIRIIQTQKRINMESKTDVNIAGSGAFLTEIFEYYGGRQVTVYVPPNRPEAIVFAGEAQRISKGVGYSSRPTYRPR